VGLLRFPTCSCVCTRLSSLPRYVHILELKAWRSGQRRLGYPTSRNCYVTLVVNEIRSRCICIVGWIYKASWRSTCLDSCRAGCQVVSRPTSSHLVPHHLTPPAEMMINRYDDSITKAKPLTQPHLPANRTGLHGSAPRASRLTISLRLCVCRTVCTSSSRFWGQ